MNPHVRALEENLYGCAKRAFTKMVDNLSDEGIYCIALYTTGGLEYLTTTCSTYEGLTAVAKKYKKSEHYAEKSIEELEQLLKWNPCDSPHHLAFEEEMVAADELMYQLSEESYELYSNDKEDASNALDQEIISTIISVLQKLDQEKVFGSGNNRENIVLNLLKGDQSNTERLNFAKQLNSQAVFDKYVSELGA